METNNNYKGRGGWRGGGRPKTNRSKTISVRVSPEAAEMLDIITTNKSQFFDSAIREAYARYVENIDPNDPQRHRVTFDTLMDN